ncbi:Papain-like cysteine peptidase superfamily [Arabidopsis thaliana x Arabidopsis arenosa]|uniref:Papain-like cysteine peptidase superfamily n=1 Tax=Arabidopsis thaliana x Arabidopsis arenosa TaxID=1240361 RepID=A0A8T1YSU5_9BRAS|nr:Papain-like cysteine peptidase superfamily [Arabidopsis thaliana x Arabidopsis arenosa]
MAAASFRRFQSLMPEIGDIVMVRVVNQDDVGADVRLLEYSDIPGRIQEVAEFVLHREEPAVVIAVSPLVVLSRDVGFDDRFLCSQRYLERSFVIWVLRSVARDLGRDLLSIQVETQWPSYELLTHRRVLKKLPVGVSPQTREDCWAHALTSQLEANLKRSGKMPRDDYLKAEDLFLKTPSNDVGVIETTTDASHALTVVGIESKKGVVYKALSMSVENGVDEPPEIWDGLLEDFAKGEVPVTVTVLWFPSYDARNGDGIYKPTDDEWDIFKKDPDFYDKTLTHSMLLTGAGTDEIDGTPYFEMQDSNGDVDHGDRGYLRFARLPYTLVLEYVEMVV